MINVRKLILKLKNNVEIFIGKFLSNTINKNKNTFTILEIFMTNNGIISKFKLIFAPKLKSKIINNDIYHKFHAEDNLTKNKMRNSKVTYPDNILLLAPKYYGNFANTVWWNLYNYLKSLNIQVEWLDLTELKSDKDFYTTINFIFRDQFKKNILFLDPLAAPERFVEYRNINQNLFNSIATRNNFRVIGLLGDIWREKDRRQIINANSFIDGFIHIDRISSEMYPEVIKGKFFFYPFVAFDTGKFKPILKKNVIVFSGQVRDSDRRYWLRTSINLSSKFKLQIKNCSWFQWNQGNALTQLGYENMLNEAQYSLSLTQKSKSHWCITARALESLLSGCTLINQEGPNFKMFENILVPYKDYLPFTNIIELNEIFDFISKYPDEAKKIGENGALKIRNFFEEEKFWNFCMGLSEFYPAM